MEQAKFTYFPLGKDFEKQTKTIKDQGEKQVDSLKTLKLKELKPKKAKLIEHDNYFLNKMAEIRKSFKQIYFLYLTYNFKNLNLAPINFIRFKGPNNISKSIHNVDITIEDVEKEQTKIKLDLSHIKQGPPQHKSPEQLNTIERVENLYESREEVVKMFNDYAKNMSRNINESKQGKGRKDINS